MILYLDIDGVLWDIEERDKYLPARGVHAFLDFALAHFEVRWLTWWFSRGIVRYDAVDRLADWIQYPSRKLYQINPSRPFILDKTEAIDFTEEFVWVDDDLSETDAYVLNSNDALHRWYYTDIFHDHKEALIRTHQRLKAYV